MNHEKWFSKSNYDTLTAVVLVGAGILLAALTFLMTKAVDEADLLDPQIQRDTIRAATTLATGQLETDYAFSQVFRLWREAESIRDNAEFVGDSVRAESYAEIRDSLIELSPLLQEPYWNAEDYLSDSIFPDYRAYEADVYVRQFAVERLQVQQTTELKNHWRGLSGDYAVMTRIIAIGLMLIGIAKTVMDSLKIKFSVTIIIGIVVLLVAFKSYTIWSEEPSLISPDAIEAFAMGEGLVHQFLYDDAVSAYTNAIDIDPTMIDAYEKRGYALRLIHYYAEDPDTTVLEQAIQDFEHVLDAGVTSRSAMTQLSELYFLLGDFEDASATSQAGVDATDDFAHHFDLGLIALANGEIESANQHYATGIEKATEEYHAMVESLGAPSPDFYFWMNLAMTELDDLLYCIEHGVCSQTPARNQLADSDDVITAIVTNARQLKELIFAFEAFDGEAPPTSDVTVTSLSIYSPDDPEAVDNAFDWYLVYDIYADFEYENVPDNAVATAKVYYGTNEYISLRQVFEISDGGSGTGELVFPVGDDTGDFRIQLFINGILVQEGRYSLYE